MIDFLHESAEINSNLSNYEMEITLKLISYECFRIQMQSCSKKKTRINQILKHVISLYDRFILFYQITQVHVVQIKRVFHLG